MAGDDLKYSNETFDVEGWICCWKPTAYLAGTDLNPG
jgi:hypothetical protein